MKILVYHTGSLGDTLIAVPALRAVRENFPAAHVTMLTDEQPGRGLVQAHDILEGSGLVDDYLFYPAGKRLALTGLLLRLRAKRFDALVYLVRGQIASRRDRRDRLFFRWAGIQRTYGLKAFAAASASRPAPPLPKSPHESDALLARLAADGLQTPAAGKGNTSIGIGPREHDNVRQWTGALPTDGGRRWFALGPGSKMPCKIWPIERFLAVARRLVAEYDLWPVVFGGPADRASGDELVRALGRGYVAAGQLSVRDSMAALERCVLFLGNDTGTMHMAAAAGVRCVVPFTARDAPGRWYPYGAGHAVFRTAVPCEGCMLEVCIEHKMECILSIHVEQVWQACQTILAEQSRSASVGREWETETTEPSGGAASSSSIGR